MEVSEGSGRTCITATVQNVGSDLMIAITGGASPHIGAVIISEPRPSRDNPSEVSVTSSRYNVIGHKDEQIGVIVSEALCRSFNCRAVTAAGVHIDDITESEIQAVLHNAEMLCARIIGCLHKSR